MARFANLLYKDRVDINDKIHIVIPTVGDVIETIGTDNDYYDMVHTLTAMPIDMMLPLSDAGYDYEKMTDYDLFCLIFGGLRLRDTRLIFGDLDLTLFEPAINEKNGMPVFVDRKHDIVIDRGVQGLIADALRKIHGLKKNVKKPANEEAKKFLLDRARKKARRRKRMGPEDSQLESLITAMVNTPEFKYDYRSVKEMTVYQFNESVHQIISKVEYDNRMIGVYTGNVSVKDLKEDELNWLVHK